MTSNTTTLKENPVETTPEAPLLQARNIAKTYGHVVALADASLHLNKGEVLGLVGDNGAGKSTLLKVLSGAIVPDGGTITIGGQVVEMKRPLDAMNAGIETVYQDLALVDTMSAFQNVYLGREVLAKRRPLRMFNFLDDKAMRAKSREVLKDLNVRVPSVNVSVKGMSGGQRQCLAIARAVIWGRQVVILDEPTAALGVQESKQVLDLILKLKDHDVSVIVVSHNMQQLVEVADRITVMRLGRSVANRTVAESSAQQIVGLITGAIPADSDARPVEA